MISHHYLNTVSLHPHNNALFSFDVLFLTYFHAKHHLLALDLHKLLFYYIKMSFNSSATSDQMASLIVLSQSLTNMFVISMTMKIN